MSVIAVAGAGHGGIVAALKLAAEGYDVTVYEKSARENCGFDQKDSFDAESMEYAGLEIPEGWETEHGNTVTFYPLDSDIEPISSPTADDYRNITVERKELLAYLFDIAEKNGVKFSFETEIYGPVMLGGRVSGLKTSKGDLYCDLVIDACGIDSPVRMNLPDYLGIEKEPKRFDYLWSYRVYMDKSNAGYEPEHKYSLYVRKDTGFEWLITEKDCVDALIVRFDELTYPEISEALLALYERNPQMGKNIIRGGKNIKISIRQPLAVFVADGYAAVGDSAFMTYATKGSGIGFALMAGTMLANTVINDKFGIYSGETLWEYEREFFREKGFDACRIALAKNLLPLMTAEEVNEIFRSKLVTSEEMAAFIGGEIGIARLPGLIREKSKTLNELPEFRSQLLTLAGWIGKFALLEPFIPGRYTREDAVKWAERYDKFFDSARTFGETHIYDDGYVEKDSRKKKEAKEKSDKDKKDRKEKKSKKNKNDDGLKDDTDE